jgi:hypothetical protein
MPRLVDANAVKPVAFRHRLMRLDGVDGLKRALEMRARYHDDVGHIAAQT